MAARTAKNLKKLARLPLRPRMVQTVPARMTRMAKRSIRERRRHRFRRFAGRAVIGQSREILLYLKKSRARRAKARRESGSEFTDRDRGKLLCFVAHAAVLHAVGKIDDQADDEPDHQAYPRHGLQSSHK